MSAPRLFGHVYGTSPPNPLSTRWRGGSDGPVGRLLGGAVAAVCLLLGPMPWLLRPAFADWPAHPDVPEWARRGNVCRAFPAPPSPLTPAELSPEEQTAAVAPTPRAGRFVTICSRGLPQAALESPAEACVVAADGRRLLLGNDPRQLVGCWSAPRFRQYLRAQMLGGPPRDGVILDNVTVYDCHCSTCRQRFREFSRLYLGRETEMPEEVDLAGPVGRAVRVFELCMARECLMELKAALHEEKPPVALALALPPQSGVAAWLSHEGIPDVVLIRRSGATPEQPTFPDLKLALAAARGGCVAAWQDDAETPAVTPQRRMLGLAEAISAGATEISPRPDAPEDPPGARWWSFAQDLLRRRGAMQPAARVAVLCSVWTGVWQPQAQHLAELGMRLQETGLPFDFVVDEDLGPQLLRQYPLLFVPNATCMSDTVAVALQAYGDAGGAVVLSGRPGACTDRGDRRVGLPRFAAAKLMLCVRPPEQMPARDLRRMILDLAAPMARLADPVSASLTFSLQRDERSPGLQVHLVNRDAQRPESNVRVMLPVALCRGWRATLTSPEHEPQALEMREQGGYMNLVVPQVRIWETIIVEPG